MKISVNSNKVYYLQTLVLAWLVHFLPAILNTICSNSPTPHLPLANSTPSTGLERQIPAILKCRMIKFPMYAQGVMLTFRYDPRITSLYIFKQSFLHIFLIMM